MKLKASKMGSIKTLKDTLKKGGGQSAAYIKNVPAEGITVRFLTEPEEWFGYYEYYDAETKSFIPMAEGEVLPDGAKPSFRYLALAVDMDSDRVIPLKLAKTCANALILKYDKYDTMMDRNYELQRHGEGLDTTYEVTPEAPSKVNLAKYDTMDLEDILLNARAQATGETPDDEPVAKAKAKPEPKAAPKAAPKKASRPTRGEPEPEDDDDIDTDDESDDDGAWNYGAYDEDALFPDGEFRINYSLAELKAMSPDDIAGLLEWWSLDDDGTLADIVAAQDDYSSTDDDADDEADEDEDEDDGGDEEEYTEDDLKAMSIRDLRGIAKDLGLDATGSKQDLIAAIIDAAEA